MPWYISDTNREYEVPDSISQDDHEEVMSYLKNARSSVQDEANNEFASTGQVKIPLDTPVEENNPGMVGMIQGIVSGKIGASDVGKGIWDTVTNLHKSLPNWAERVNSQDPQEREQAILEGITAAAGGGMGTSGTVGGAGTAGMFVGQSGRMNSWLKNGAQKGLKITDTEFNQIFEDVKKEYILPGKDTISPAGMDLAKDKMWRVHKAEQMPDGGWRTEIPDDEAIFRSGIAIQFQNSFDLDQAYQDVSGVFGDSSITKNYKLSDVIEHDEMFKNYPEFKDYEVEFITDPNTPYGKGEGLFNPNSNKISVRTSNPREAKSILMHELQHGIQYKEKWAQGGNTKAMTYLADELRTERDVYDKAIKGRKQELKNLGKSLEDDAEYAAFVNARTKIHKNILELEGWRSKTKGIDNPAYDVYHRLLGEIEARNVQRRMGSDGFMNQLSKKTGLTPEELRAKFRPSDTTDVNTKDSRTFLYKQND